MLAVADAKEKPTTVSGGFVIHKRDRASRPIGYASEPTALVSRPNLRDAVFL